MCGRVFIRTGLDAMVEAFAFAGRQVEIKAMASRLPRYNGAPMQEYPIIIRETDVAGAVFVRARWGLRPAWQMETRPRRPAPINVRVETVAGIGMFRSAYRSRRALMPVDGYFEWRAIKGEKVKQPWAIAMADRRPFALAAIWERRKNPDTGLEERTFCLLTCEPNELTASIHDRMPIILQRADYRRWLADSEAPSDLGRPLASDRMTRWPIGRDVGNVRNNRPDLLDRIELDQ